MDLPLFGQFVRQKVEDDFGCISGLKTGGQKALGQGRALVDIGFTQIIVGAGPLDVIQILDARGLAASTGPTGLFLWRRPFVG